MFKEETLNYYQAKLEDVVQYIRENLGSDLSTALLAEYSNISFFHFHRIMKAGLGMPLGAYVNRLRLDTAARLIRDSGDTIGEIAARTGFSDVSALSKSFSREFGISPQAYRENKESSIQCNIDFSYQAGHVEKLAVNPKVAVFPERQIIYIGVRGTYGGAESYAAWQELEDFIRKKKLPGWNPDFFSIYYDDPEAVGAENCRYDCCMTVRKKTEPEGRVKYGAVEGGKYLVFRYKGPWEKLWEIYDLIYREYLIGLDQYRIRDAPSLEKYCKYSEKTKPENQLTEIYLPIE